MVVHLEVAHPVSDRTQPNLSSAKLMELAGSLGQALVSRAEVQKEYILINSVLD